MGEVISGNTVQSLPLNGRNAGQLALLLPGTVTYNPRGFTNIGSVNMNRPFVNGNREQTNNFTVDGLDVNETIDNRVAYQPSPDALAEISVETNNYAADVGNVGGRHDQQRHQVGVERVPRQRLRVLPEQRLRREHLGEQPLGRSPPGAHAAHLRGHPRAVPSSRTSSSSSLDYQGSRQDAPGATTASVAPEAWRRGDLSSISTVIRDPVTSLPFPGNQIPLEPDQPDGARHPERPRELPASEPHGAGRGDGELRGRDPVQDPRPPGRPASRLERLPERQALRPRLVRHLQGPARRAGLPARASPPGTTSPSTTSASTGTACSVPRSSTRCSSARATRPSPPKPSTGPASAMRQRAPTGSRAASRSTA